MELITYIKSHRILKVGKPISPEYICVETIVDCPKDFINMVYSHDCYISEIRWWHRTLISRGSEIGYGGPCDPRDPTNYYFAETDFSKSFVETCSAQDCYSYIEFMTETYSKYDLYPAFHVKLRRYSSFM